MEYYVHFNVNGTVCVRVDAETEKDAIDIANDILCEADFGELENIDWEHHWTEH